MLLCAGFDEREQVPNGTTELFRKLFAETAVVLPGGREYGNPKLTELPTDEYGCALHEVG